MTIYGIDPRGIGAGLDEAIELQSLPDETNPMGPVFDAVRHGQDSLRSVSEDTGGFAAVNHNDLNDSFARIIRENSSYYVLGYYPAGDKRDGRFHNVDVRVKRPGLTVRARKGYVAPVGNVGARVHRRTDSTQRFRRRSVKRWRARSRPAMCR